MKNELNRELPRPENPDGRCSASSNPPDASRICRSRNNRDARARGRCAVPCRRNRCRTWAGAQRWLWRLRRRRPVESRLHATASEHAIAAGSGLECRSGLGFSAVAVSQRVRSSARWDEPRHAATDNRVEPDTRRDVIPDLPHGIVWERRDFVVFLDAMGFRRGCQERAAALQAMSGSQSVPSSSAWTKDQENKINSTNLIGAPAPRRVPDEHPTYGK
ncbi:MAG: hypothetical protein QOF15_12 [Mycobacterium sp.]|nr:hypothetical protein [Mycobacterium sp.]